MRRIVFLFLAVGLTLPAAVAAHAGDEHGLASDTSLSRIAPDGIPYPSPLPPDISTGSSAIYAQVTFDGEGEAAVAFDLELADVDKELKEVTLLIPGEGIRIRRALQEYTIEKEIEQEGGFCEQYGDYDPNLHDYPCLKAAKQTIQEIKVERIEAQTTTTADGLAVILPLAHTIAVGESTKIAMAYKANGYAQTRAGLWRFTYPTPPVPYDIDTVSVRVDVTEGLTLKGGQAATQYQTPLAEGIASGALTAFQSGFGAKFSEAVAEPAAFVKTTSALDPNESFEVAGAYAKYWLRIYWAEGVLVLLAIAFFVGLIVWGERRAARLGTKREG